jgi:hypothetical protein
MAPNPGENQIGRRVRQDRKDSSFSYRITIGEMYSLDMMTSSRTIIESLTEGLESWLVMLIDAMNELANFGNWQLLLPILLSADILQAA